MKIFINAGHKVGKGTETYCYRNSTTGRKFATSVHKSIVKKFPAPDVVDKPT